MPAGLCCIPPVQEAEKKRTAIAAKRKEREEQKGNAGKQANTDASARAPEEKRPRLEQVGWSTERPCQSVVAS
eukprot:23138-Eustigmatos_ZCMA.PRE.1